MATDEERLLVRIEAQMRQFEKAMAKAPRDAERAAKRIESRFGGMERRLANVGAGLGRSLIGPLAAFASAREIAQAIDAYTRIQNALTVAGVAAEDQAAIFDRLFAAAQKNAAPIESLVELYGRAALVQKELGVSSEELLRFTEGVAAALRVSGKSAAESSGALLQLSQALGSGVVRAEEFNSILEGALPIAQAAARGLEEAGGSVAKLRQLVIDGKVSSEAFFRAFEAGQGSLEKLAETTDITLGGAMTRLENSFIRLVGSINDSTHASDALKGALGGLATAFDGLPGLVEAFRAKLDELNKTNGFLDFLIVTQDEAAAFTKQLEDMQAAADKAAASSATETLRSKIAEVEADLAKMRADTTGLISPQSIDHAIAELSRLKSELASVALQRIEVRGGPGGGGSRGRVGLSNEDFTVSLRDFKVPTRPEKPRRRANEKTPDQKFDDDIVVRIRERTAALNLETAAVAKSTFEAERMRAVQDLLNEAKRAGLTITPELTAKIEAEADAYARASQTLETTEQHYRDIQEAQSFFAETAFDSFSELIPIIETGNAALDRLLQTLIEAALQAALLGNGPLAGLFGTATHSGSPGGLFGKLIGGLVGGTGGAAAASVPAAAPFAVPAVPRIPAAVPARAAAPAVVRLSVVEGQMFEPRVAAISGNVTVRMTRGIEERAVARAPAVARDHQRRFATPG